MEQGNRDGQTPALWKFEYLDQPISYIAPKREADLSEYNK